MHAMHVMDHRINLREKALDHFTVMDVVEELVTGAYNFITYNCFDEDMLKEKQKLLDLPELPMLQDVETHWISQCATMECVQKHVPALTLVADEAKHGNGTASKHGVTDLLTQMLHSALLPTNFFPFPFCYFLSFAIF
jgi:hypothetical protein